MIMKKLLSLALCLSVALLTQAQTTYTYNFGSDATGVFTYPGTSTSATATANSDNADVTPTLVGTALFGGTAKIKKSTAAAAGYMELINGVTTFGSGNRLKIAYGNSDGQKFSIYGWGSPTKYGYASFNVRLESGTKGQFFFSMGNEAAGSNYSNGGSPSTVGVVAAIRFNYNATAPLITLSTIIGTGAGGYNGISGSNTQTFANGGEYAFAIYTNNSTTNITYTRNLVDYILAASSFQIWVGAGRLRAPVSSGVSYDFPKGNVANDAVVDGLAFYGASNSSNPNTESAAIVDDVVYGSFAATVLPVSLTSFTGASTGDGIKLNWTTASEKNNNYFEVEKSTDGVKFTKIATKNGAVNSNSVLKYSIVDDNPSAGTNYYRLSQTDLDGTKETFKTIAVKFGIGASKTSLAIFTNGNSGLNFGINAASSGNGDFAVFNTAGQKLLSKKLAVEKGENTFSIEDAGLTTGTYVATFKLAGKLITKKFVK